MTKQVRDINGILQRTVYVVLDRYYDSRAEAQAAVDAICDAGYGVPEIQEYLVDRES